MEDAAERVVQRSITGCLVGMESGTDNVEATMTGRLRETEGVFEGALERSGGGFGGGQTEDVAKAGRPG